MDDHIQETETTVNEQLSEVKPDPRSAITVDEDYSFPNTEWDEEAITVRLPSDTSGNTKDVLEKTPNINLVDNPDSRKWAGVVNDGLEYTTFANAFGDVFKNTNAHFRQGIEYNNQRYQAQAPKLKNTENENLKGERAVLRVLRQLGLGTTFQVPLWHSGIWVTLKPPTESEIIELNRLLINEKIRMGRYTYGLIYSNTTAYTIDILVDFIISHIYTTTVKSEELPISSLKNFLSVQDLFTLIWGFACTMYPKGFQYQRACLTDPEKCHHVLEEKLNLSKLLWTNNNVLTDWQKSHMASRQPFDRDLSAVKKYRDEMLSLKSRRIKLSKEGDETELYITLKSPMVSDYISEGHKWISGIIDKIKNSVVSIDDDIERNNIVQRFAQSTSMRQYTQWVESIELDTNIINDRETIETTLDIMSADDYIRDTFIEKVVNYINDSTMAVVGIPTYNCPKCASEQKGEIINNEFTNIIPLDVVQLFFGLTTQRIQKITTR